MGRVLNINKDELSDCLNTATTTVLGMVGALTMNPILQACAFLPAVSHKIYIKFKSGKPRDTIDSDLKALLKETCISTQKILSKDNKERAEFFKYANMRIENNKNITGNIDWIDTIKKDLEIEKRSQAVGLTTIDLNELSQIFAKNFISGLCNYPKLESYLFATVLSDHEKRITNLEQEKSLAKSNELSIEAIYDDKEFFLR